MRSQEDAETIAWQAVTQRAEQGRKGRKVCLARFLGGFNACADVTDDWYMQLLERTVCGLNEDFLKGKRFTEAVVKAGPVEMGTAEGSTKAVVNADLKMMRSACENAVAISVMFLSDETARRYMFIIKVCGRECKTWHSDQNHRMRSGDGCGDWVTEMCCGGVSRHADACLEPLSCRKFLEDAQFVCTAGAAKAMGDEIIAENEFAAVCGNLCLELNARRVRRLLWLVRGWPWSMTRALQSDDHFDSTVDRFEQDLMSFQVLEAHPNKCEAVDKKYRRHQMRKRSNFQFRQSLFHRGHHLYRRDLKKVIRDRARCACPTQIIEEVNGIMKNKRNLRMTTRARRPQKAMGLVLQSKLFQKSHKWKSIPVEAPTGPKGKFISQSSFLAAAKGRSLPFHTIVSTLQAVPWYSPASKDYSANTADLQLIADARRKGDLDLVQNAWQGTVCKASHNLLLAKHVGGQREWYVALDHLDASACIVRPVQRVVVPNSPYTTFSFLPSSELTDLLSILDLDDYMAVDFSWKSPAWQFVELPPGSTGCMSVRGFVSREPMPLRLLIALLGYFQLPRSTVELYSQEAGVVIEKGWTFPQLLYYTILKLHPQLTPGEIMRIIALRLSAHEANLTFADELLDLDEAYTFISRPDVDKLKAEQRKVETEQENEKTFKRQYRNLHRELLPKPVKV